jgi:3-hydroxymyristoyl/3-hydroxydecanoyl-(acyl carrier protein) dehydratase
VRYLFVDHVTEIEPDRSIVAIKNVTRESDVMEHHFYESPVFPGALTIEVMAQTAGYLLMRSAATLREEHVLGLLSSVERAHFHKAVFPGDQLKTEAIIEERKGPLAYVRAVVTVDGRTVARARLVMTVVEVGDGTDGDVGGHMASQFRSVERKGVFYGETR